MSRWAVAVTKPNYERLAEEHLIRQGFMVYIPRFKAKIIVRGQICYREQILFRRYIFVQISNTWHAILRTFGIVGVLQSGNAPAIVPDNIIKELKSRDVNGFIRLPALRKGQKVRVTDGPFLGRTGIYQGMTNRQRESVLLTAMGCRLELTQGNLVAV